MLTLSNVGETSWSLIPKSHIQVQKEKKRLSSLVYVFHIRKIKALDEFTHTMVKGISHFNEAVVNFNVGLVYHDNIRLHMN